MASDDVTPEVTPDAAPEKTPGERLAREAQRVRNLLGQYYTLGIEDADGATALRTVIAEADEAARTGDAAAIESALAALAKWT